MMKSGLLMVVAASALIFVGCATAPDPLARKTSDDCLVLIRTTLANPDNSPLDRHYTLIFSADYPDREIPNTTRGFIALVIRGPHVLVTKIASRVTGQSHGDSTSQVTDFELPYEPNKVIVADFIFSQEVRKTGERQFMTSFDIDDITAADRDSVLAEFRKTEAGKGWGTS